MRETVLRVVWGWLGYGRGLPVNNAGLERAMEKYTVSLQSTFNHMISEQLMPQLNQLRKDVREDPERIRRDLAGTIMSGLCAQGAPDAKRSVELADELLKALK